MNKRVSSRRCLRAKFDSVGVANANSNPECSTRSNCQSWCDAFSISMTNVNARQAWKSGTEKISQTLNNVRSTFGTLSQKITKSTKRRQPLINIDSPRTPATPSSRSKALLGRTPTKLYSPFHIDTPKQKENVMSRGEVKKRSPKKGSFRAVKTRFKRSSPADNHNNRINFSCHTPEKKLSNDLLQTQIGIYEFQSVANDIVQKGKGMLR